MKVGLTVPQFRDDVDAAVATARQAEALGLDGVFVFDHLWPMGEPHKPAVPSTVMLGALTAATSTIGVGTLVSRVGLRPDAVLIHELLTAARVAGPGRVIAGIGTGDRLSADENLAYGLAYPPAAERLAAVDRCARALLHAELEVWVGGRSGAIRQLVRDLPGAALNLWAVPVEMVADAAVRGFTVTWAGPLPAGVTTEAQLGALAEAGASWAVIGWPKDLEELAAAAP